MALGSGVGSGVSVSAGLSAGDVRVGALLGSGSGAGLQPDRLVRTATLISSAIQTPLAPALPADKCFRMDWKSRPIPLLVNFSGFVWAILCMVHLPSCCFSPEYVSSQLETQGRFSAGINKTGTHNKPGHSNYCGSLEDLPGFPNN